MNKTIEVYNESQTFEDQEICELLANVIDDELTEAESKIWHAHPVWFIDDNQMKWQKDASWRRFCEVGVILQTIN